MNKPRRLVACWLPACSAGLLATGCAVGPDFQAPAAPMNTRYAEASSPMQRSPGSSARVAEPGGSLPAALDAPIERPARAASVPTAQAYVDASMLRADWWKVFACAPLDALIDAALSSNPDLAATEASLRIAEENLAAERGAFLPSVQAQYQPTRQTVSNDLTSPLSSGKNRYTLHTATLDIGYVPDVFGGTRRATESLQATAEAQRHQLDAARLTLVASLVSAVIEQASLREQADSTRELADLARRQLAMVRRQQQLGQLGSPDVLQQELAVAQAEALLPSLERQATQQSHLIAQLTGRAGEQALPHDIPLDALVLPANLPSMLPSQLVQRRPDILAAQAQWHAATAQVGVAEAARLPSIALTASAGSNAQRLSQLFANGTGFWGLGANLLAPLFDGGTLAHRQGAAEAAVVQSAAMYRSTVQVAFQNVADTLVAIDADNRSLDRQQAAELASRRSLDVAQRLHGVGSTGALPVLVAQQAAVQATLATVQARAARLTDSVALFQALGGSGWIDAAVERPSSD